MGSAIKLVIFDLDGTLVDAYKAVAASVNYMLKELGRPPAQDEHIKRSVGWGPRHLIETFAGAEDLARAVSIYRQHHARALKSGTSWLPGASALLKTLKEKGYKLAIASNRPTRFTHIILKHLKGDTLFDHVLCADRVENPKPAAEILEKTLAKFSLGTEAALYVGDMTIDIETGRAAGVRTVAVATGSNTKKELAALNPTAVIDRISNLTDVLKEIG